MKRLGFREKDRESVRESSLTLTKERERERESVDEGVGCATPMES